jgi:hypothetical protein
MGVRAEVGGCYRRNDDELPRHAVPTAIRTDIAPPVDGFQVAPADARSRRLVEARPRECDRPADEGGTQSELDLTNPAQPGPDQKSP